MSVFDQFYRDKLEHLWEISLDGTDTQVGSVDELGWYGVVTDTDNTQYILASDSQGNRDYWEWSQESWNEIMAEYDRWYSNSNDNESEES